MPHRDEIIMGAPNPVEGKAIPVPDTHNLSEKIEHTPEGPEINKAGALDPDNGITIAPIMDDSDPEKDTSSEDAIIVTGADASLHLLPLRDDHDPAITFRGLFLATVLSCFQATMYQIYQFKPTAITIQGTFVVLIAYFLGNGWAMLLPRGDLYEARFRAKNGLAPLPLYIKFFKFINSGPWSLKEHAIVSITATSASNGADSISVFTAQMLFYDLPLSPATIICAIISIGLFGYGLCGILRPITVWHVEAVYWGSLPTVKTLQGLHWQEVKNSKPLRWFWIAFCGMFAWEWLPAYIWPWLNSISIPCLASMNATGNTGNTLTMLFGGASNNEGLGLFSVSLDWQYLTSFQTALPLKLQVHQALGFGVCFIAMLGIWYSNAWQSQNLPFMSSHLWSGNGTAYPTSDVFVDGVLDQNALVQTGLPFVTGTFAYAMFMANAAIGALVAHCFLFWGGDIARTFKSARKGEYSDRHHVYMAKTYKECPWWWYLITLILSFILGLIVVIRENLTLPAWGYVVALLVGICIAPLSTILFSRFGNGIATNNLSKMLAGLLIPERPVGNMYFAAWSHNVILATVNLSTDLKMGEYLKIPPRVMFLTQVYGTVLGGFINYVIMTSIVSSHRELLISGNGDSSWSGATIQSYNTNATSWALAKYLYSPGQMYELVPVGLGIGAGIVAVHRLIAYFVPKVRGFSLYEINMPQFIQYAGYIPYYQSQTCVILSWLIAGFFCQFYLRNYKPRFFKNYMYLITGAFDGASLTALFIMSFAVFGAGGPSIPFPQWWGNNVNGNLDWCPVQE